MHDFHFQFMNTFLNPFVALFCLVCLVLPCFTACYGFRLVDKANNYLNSHIDGG